MPYRIEAFPVSEKLEYLEQNDNEIYQLIWAELNRISVYVENFRTGSPEILRVFAVGKYRVIYAVDHKYTLLIVLELLELPPPSPVS